MANELTTQPTLETLLEMMREVRDNVTKLEERLNVRLDRIEAEVKQSHSEMYTMRADFTELRAALREQLAAPK
jgi:chaperonin cofactor prefoldin